MAEREMKEDLEMPQEPNEESLEEPLDERVEGLVQELVQGRLDSDELGAGEQLE